MRPLGSSGEMGQGVVLDFHIHNALELAKSSKIYRFSGIPPILHFYCWDMVKN